MSDVVAQIGAALTLTTDAGAGERACQALIAGRRLAYGGEAATGYDVRVAVRLRASVELVAEDALGVLDAALEVAGRVEGIGIDAEADEGIGDVG